MIVIVPYGVNAMEKNQDTKIHNGVVQLLRTPSSSRAYEEYQTVCERLDRVITAFKGINVTPLKAFDSGADTMSLLCTVPDGFINFVNSRDQIPPSKRVNLMYPSGKEPHYNCDFWYDLSYGNKEGFIDQVISLGHGSCSVPDLSIRLWGYKDPTTTQLLATPNTVVFYLHIFRGMEGLERGLKNAVERKLVEGIYVIIPKEAHLVDWKNNPDVVEKLKESQQDYRYQWVAH